MSGVRSVLTDTLREHYPVFDPDGHINGTVPGRGSWECFCGLVYGISKDEVLEHVTHVLLGLSGVAVTQLPAVDEPAEADLALVSVDLLKRAAAAVGRWPTTAPPRSARYDLAADLLVAANRAEQEKP